MIPHLPFASLLLASPLAANEVLVVAETAGPGVDHTSIDAALIFAADGDIVLVRPGAYSIATTPSVPVDGKAVMLVADGAVTVDGAIAVQNLDATRTFSMRGFTSAQGLALTATACSGVVWVEDCDLGNAFSFPDVILSVFSSASNVNLLRTTYLAGATTSLDSQLNVYDCDFAGESLGHPGSYDIPLFLNGGSLFASGSSFASSFEGIILDLVVINDPTLFLLEPIADDLPPATLLPGPARSYHADATVREGQPLSLTVDGEPGDFVFVFASKTPLSSTLPIYSGALMMAPSNAPLFLGALPPSGTLQTSVTMPQLPPGVEGSVFYSQAVFFEEVGGTPILGPASMVVLLDGSL